MKPHMAMYIGGLTILLGGSTWAYLNRKDTIIRNGIIISMTILFLVYLVGGIEIHREYLEKKSEEETAKTLENLPKPLPETQPAK